MLRDDVEEATSLVNNVLEVAGHPFRVVTSWQSTTFSEDLIPIKLYVVRSKASPQALANRQSNVRAALQAIWSDDSGIKIDEALDACTELDDCVERLYPEASLQLLLQIMNSINANELGKADLECRCVILIADDILVMKEVFAANWDGYILTLRYDTVEELEADKEAGIIGEALYDQVGLPVEALISFIILHEVGHHSEVEPATLPGRADAFIASLNPDKQAEVAADAFVAEALLKRCYRLPRPELLVPLCLTPAAMGMLTFVIGMKAKSKTARCVRFLDPSSIHPNWQARFGLINIRFSPENEKARALFEDYLDVREGLLELDWPFEEAGCKTSLAATRDQ